MKKLLLCIVLAQPLFPMAELEHSPIASQETFDISHHSILCSLCGQDCTAISKSLLFDIFATHALDAHNIYGLGSIDRYFNNNVQEHYEELDPLDSSLE